MIASNVDAQARRVDRRERTESLDERGGRESIPAERHESCHRLSVASDGHSLAGEHPVKHVPALMAQLAHRCFAHSRNGYYR